MSRPRGKSRPEPRWERHASSWRDPAQVVSHWLEAGTVDRPLLQARSSGDFWETLERLDVTLLVTREYEHVIVGLTVRDGRPRHSHFQVPHPSGLAVDRERGEVHLAATRNPNQVMTFAPVERALARSDVPAPRLDTRPLLPRTTRFLPGAAYLHDLALVGGRLHGNAVGMNAVVDLGEGVETIRPVWWPRSVEGEDGPDFTRNHLQLNSIAGGPDLAGSYFTASVAAPSARRPGHRNWTVDRRGVVFSGATREPVASGLTRPHSARLRNGEVWVDDSGYGGLCVLRDDAVETVTRLPGWTRGLCMVEDVAFVGTSRVIPRFRQYAPGLDVERSVCGIHAVDVRTGAPLGSLRWPYGNQIFAVDWLPSTLSGGFPSQSGRAAPEQLRRVFYGFDFGRGGQ
jgi:uncharacterized protein (TIGR03032 family)